MPQEVLNLPRDGRLIVGTNLFHALKTVDLRLFFADTDSMVRYLVFGLVVQLDQRDRWRETPLHKAARSGNSAVVKALCSARMKVRMQVA